MSTINLLPEDYLLRRSRKRANVLCLILFAVVMAGVMGAAVVTDRNGRTTRKVCDQVNASYAEAARLIEQVQQLQQQKALLTAKAEQAATLQERVPRSFLLGILTNACPDRASLLSVRLETKTTDKERMSKYQAIAAQRSSKVPPVFVDLVVTGQAGTDMDVGCFMRNLENNPLLTGVGLVYSEERNQEGMTFREFQVKMEVRPGMDAIDAAEPLRDKAADLAATVAEGRPLP